MIKLINNWVYTLIEMILFLVFAVLLVVLKDIFNILLGVALIVYSLIFVMSKVISYRGVIQMITIVEFFAVTILAIFIIVDQNIVPNGNIVNGTVGVAMWLRATTEILHSYHGQGEGRQAKREFNAWKIFAYILLLTAGTFVATNASAKEDLVRYLIVGISVAAAIIMLVLTITNYRDYRESNPLKVHYADKTELLEENNGDEIPEIKESEPVKKISSRAKKPEIKAESEIIYEPAEDNAPKSLPAPKKTTKSKK